MPTLLLVGMQTGPTLSENKLELSIKNPGSIPLVQ